MTKTYKNPRKKQIIYTKHQLAAHNNINNLIAQITRTQKITPQNIKLDKEISSFMLDKNMQEKKQINNKQNIKEYFQQECITETFEYITKISEKLEEKREKWIEKIIFLY
jgi:hypothetical protein